LMSSSVTLSFFAVNQFASFEFHEIRPS
jgi:hypothetical protein